MLDVLLGNKGADLENLLGVSLKVIGEKDLKTPYLNRLLFSAVLHIVTLTFITMICYQFHRGQGMLLFILSLFVLYPYSFFFHVRMRALQTWMSYAAITGKKSSLEEARNQANKSSWNLRLFAFIEFLIASRGNENNKNGNFLKEMVISMLATIFDVAEDYLLPTLVIEHVSLKEAVPKLEQLKSNVPATLSGAFGIDVFSDAVSLLGLPVYFFVFAIGVCISLVSVPFLPADLIFNLGPHFPSNPAMQNVHLFLFPIFVSILVISYIRKFVKISATSFKSIYFATFYTSINRPTEIREDIRGQVTHYLNFSDSSKLHALKQDLKAKLPNVFGGQSKVTAATDPEMLNMIKIHVETYRKQNQPDDKIVELLKTSGWPQDYIEQVMPTYKKSV